MPENELEILKTAILNESEGEQFYTLAAEKATEEDAKDAFLYLAEEEKKHRNWLEKLYLQIKSQEEIIIDFERLDDISSPNIFTAKKIRPESGSIEVSVFHIGILMEKASIDFYREAAQKTSLDKAKELYEMLVQWEMKHMETLEKTYDYLKEEWWDKQGFSPA